MLAYLECVGRIPSHRIKVSPYRVYAFAVQVGVALDVPALYGGTQPSVESVEQTDQDFAENADSEAPPVDQSDLGGVEQLKMVEVLLAKGAGLEAGLKGVAMTR